jgi:predicted metalloprotease with PDZ domain
MDIANPGIADSIRTSRLVRRSRLIVVGLVAFLAFSVLPAVGSVGTMAFTVSMEKPETHYYHVVFRCSGLGGDSLDFKMPSWTPGYYRIMDYARNLLNFRAADGAGSPLPWEKTAKNAWRVTTRGSETVVVSYDVYAFTRFVAESFLDDMEGFICPAGVFLYVAGRIAHPVTVAVEPFSGWDKISTGLDPLAGRPNTFLAPDFDVLYDCPILVGNQEVLAFRVRGIPHAFVGSRLGEFDRGAFVRALTRMIEAAAALMGDIPYRHYTFISIGPGRGGLEHANSSVLSFDSSGLETPAGRRRWLSFVCHEYFHLYNVKRIRPIALGPFDYDRENYTRLLWVSEGFTVYYEALILNRAGLLSREDVLGQFQSSIRGFEGIPGHLFQSAEASSFDTWLQSFSSLTHVSNTTISYYDKGAVLGMLLDLKIREATRNRASLDDVMRTLYRVYYRQKKRGFTDAEFRRACEETAGVSLAELFDYAATTRDIDYPKYLAYGGLGVDLEPRPRPGGWLGVSSRDQGGVLTVSGVEWDSPAARAGLSLQDEIISLDGVPVDRRTLDEELARRKPGDTVKLVVARRSGRHELQAVLGQKTERTFTLSPLPHPSPLQAEILGAWLKD